MNISTFISPFIDFYSSSFFLNVIRCIFPFVAVICCVFFVKEILSK